jgi:membrane-bound ClpP family serine protease
MTEKTDEKLTEPTEGLESFSKIITQPIDELAVKIVSIRKKPLLVLYWHDHEECVIEPGNEVLVYKELRKNLNSSFNDIDVIVHTLGGDGNTGFMIIKAIREFSKFVTILVPEKAHSCGTLIAFGGNEIMFGHCATLSAIDQQMSDTSEINIGSASYLKYFLDFTREVMDVLDEDLDKPTGVETMMMSHAVQELGVKKIAEVYRMNRLSKYYVSECLHYAFPRKEQDEHRREIIDVFTDDSPSHSAIFDYDVCNGLLLPVIKMDFTLSDLTKELVEKLSELSESYSVCELMKDNLTRYPFVRYYPAPAPTVDDVKVDDSR